MKVNLLLCLLLSNYIVCSQNLFFLDSDNKPVKDVYFEYVSNDKKIKKISDENGLIILNQIFFQKLNYKISHLSFESIKGNHFLRDTTFYLVKKNFITDEVFITAQIKPGKISEVIQKPIIISRKEIEMQAANNLKDLLNKQTNMRLGYDNVLGSNVSVQGISGQNVKILIDGVPIIGRLNGNIDLGQINLNNVERVEIIEGPLSVDFGTDALAGTINLITDKEFFEGFSSNYNLYYESVGQYNSDLSFNFKHNLNSFKLDLGRKYFDGWSEDESFSLFPTSQLADTNRVKSWNPKEQFFGKIQFKNESNKNTIRVYYDSFYEKITNFGFPRLPYYENAFDDYYYTYRNNLGLDNKYNLNEKENFHLLSSFNSFKRIKNTYFKDLITLDEELTNNSSDQDTSSFDLFMNKLVFSSYKYDNFNYQIGFDSKFENAKGVRINTKDNSIADHAIYFSSKWQPNDYIALKPSLRVSYNSNFNVPIIPSLNTKLTLEDFVVRFSYAKGFRSPTIKELYFEFVDVNHNILGNENLVPENSDNFQLNFDYAKRYNSSRIESGVKFYYNNILDLITLAQSPNSSEYSYFNVGNYKTRGISSSVSYFTDKINLSSSYSFTGRFNDLSEQTNDVSYLYSNSLNTSINYKLKKHYATLSLYYNFVGKLPVFYKVNDEIVEAEIESYQILDLILNKSFINGKINFSVGIKNLLNVKEITNFAASDIHSSSNSSQSVAYGRTLFTSLNFKL